MHCKTLAVLAAVTGVLAVPSAAGAHVTVHPNVIPEGAYAVLNVRVPNESDDADTIRVSVQMPAGFESASTSPPPGWKAEVVTEGDAVTRVDFSGGSIPPRQFVEFPLSVAVPGRSGDTLAFKALQTYDDGEVVRWIGAPDSDKPASTITISDAGGLIEDSTGDHGGGSHAGPADTAATTRVVREGAGDGLAIAALVVGGLGLAAGGTALVTRKRA